MTTTPEDDRDAVYIPLPVDEPGVRKTVKVESPRPGLTSARMLIMRAMRGGGGEEE